MKIFRTIEKRTDWEEIKMMIAGGEFNSGDEIEIEGALWRVLEVDEDKKSILIWKHTMCDDYVDFNHNGSSAYEGSDLQNYLQNDFLEQIPEEMKELVSIDGFFPLSIEELREYLPQEADRIATDEDGDTVWYWLRSAFRGNGYHVWYVGTSGYAHGSYAAYAYRCAPACRLLIH